MLCHLNGACIIAAVVFGPMAFGAVEPWAYSILAVLSFTALAASFLHALGSDEGSGVFPFPAVIGLIALVLTAFQLIPLPAGILRWVQPGALSVHERIAAALGRPMPAYMTSSLYPHGTRTALLKAASYAALFAAACGYINSRRRLNRIAITILTVGFLASMVGILQSLSGVRAIFGLRECRMGFGPFPNRNQFAAYATIPFFIGFGILLARNNYMPVLPFRRIQRGKLPSPSPGQGLLLIFMTAVTGSAIVFSLSRGGIISAVLAGAVLVLSLLISGYTTGRWKYILAVLLVVLALLTYLGWEPVIERLKSLGIVISDPGVEGMRLGLWRDAWRMGLTFPFVGAGAGAFQSVYPAFRTVPTDMYASNPHNEYLAVLAETGFAGLVIMLFALGWVIAVAFRSLLRARRNTYVQGCLAGGIGAVSAVSFHSVVDFPLRSPGTVAVLMTAAAIMYRLAGFKQRTPPAVGRGAKAETEDSPSGHDRGRKGTVAGKAILTALVLAGWMFAVNSALGGLHYHFETLRIARAEDKLTPAVRGAPNFVEASRSVIERRLPHDARLHARLGAFARKAAMTVDNRAAALMLAEQSLDLWETAAGLDPLHPRYRLNVVVEYLAFGRVDIAWVHARLGADLLPGDPWIRRDLAETFFLNGLNRPGIEMLDELEVIAEERGLRALLRWSERMRKEHGVE